MIRFLTTKEDEELPTFVISSVEEKYKNLWGKTREGFRRAYEELYEDIDWVIKADDDTYVVMENLRYLLSDQDALQPVWFGCEFKVIVKDGGYMSGGAGYVLSKGASFRDFVYEKENVSRITAKVRHRGPSGPRKV